MNSQDLHNLQEAYLDVYDEEYKKLPVGKMMWKAVNRTEREADTRVDREREANDPYSTISFDRAREEHEKAEKNKERNYKMIRVADTHSKKEAKAKSKLKTEQVDLYDIILSHLLDEGYAETQEAAEVIMVNMSEDWRESIVEGMKRLPVGEMIKQAARHSNPEQVTKMAKVADDHNPTKSKRKEDDNRREGGRKREAGRPRRNELQDNW
jgi:hypothetical protein